MDEDSELALLDDDDRLLDAELELD